MKVLIIACLSIALTGCSTSHDKAAQQPVTSSQPAQAQSNTEKTNPSLGASTPASIPKEIFPEAPKTVRSVDCFRSFVQGVSMYAVVQKCGRPDRELGSGIGYFVYDLDDGTSVWIRWTDINHISDISHSYKSGKSSSLLSKK